MSHMRVAMKYFTLGLLLGLVFAPSAGTETRGRLVSAMSEGIGNLFGGDA